MDLATNIFVPGSRLAATFDCFETMAETGDNWDQRYWQPVPGRFFGDSTIVHTGHLQLSHTLFAPGILVNGAVTGGCYTFGLVLGRSEQVFCQSRQIDQAEMFVGRLGQEIDFRAYHDCELLILCVSEALFRRFLHQHGIELSAGQLPDHLPFSSAQRRRDLVQTWLAWHQNVARNPEVLANPVVAAEFEEHILEVLPLPLKRPVAGHEGRLAYRFRIARQAETILRQHESRPVTMGDLCQRLGVNARTLRQGFLECYGTSPKRYHRLLRLNAVYRVCRQAPRDRTRISDVAHELGFSELGRLSVEYRQLFGESPSQTLTRG